MAKHGTAADHITDSHQSASVNICKQTQLWSWRQIFTVNAVLIVYLCTLTD